MLDRGLIAQVAADLQTDESYVEKDWHIVRALGVIAGIAEHGVRPVFSGGTALAKGWRVVKRFSEDIDFKIGVTAPNEFAARTRRSAYRKSVLAALAEAGFMPLGEPQVSNRSLFVRASFGYDAIFPPADGVRPGIRIEMTFMPALREPTERPLQSLLAEAGRRPPEVAAFLCVDPVETAADKIAALAWRTHARDRSAADDDPTIVRHLHDLAALAGRASEDPGFAALARAVLDGDAARAKGKAPDGRALDGRALLERMLPKIASDPLWREEYGRFVAELSYAREADAIDFDRAIAACEHLASQVLS